MVILNQIVGAGDFSIADNLRLIVIAVIFVGIIAVLLYLRFAKSIGKTNGEYISEEKMIKGKSGEDLEYVVKSAVKAKKEPVVNIETIEEIIKNSETEIITKFAADIKDVRDKTDMKLTEKAEDIRLEFTTKIENLISKIEEREKEVVNKIENVIDTKVQEALNKMNDRIGAALHSQKDPTASVLEKLVDSLRTEEVPAGDLASEKAEEVAEEKIDCEEVKKKESEEAVGESTDFDMQKFLDEIPVSASPSGGSEAVVDTDVVPEEIKEEELEGPSEDNANVELDERMSGGTVGDSADFDIQEFLDELENLPSKNDSEAEK